MYASSAFTPLIYGSIPVLRYIMGTHNSVISVTVTLLCFLLLTVLEDLFLKTQRSESLCARVTNLGLKGLKLKIFCIKKNNLPLSGYQI